MFKNSQQKVHTAVIYASIPLLLLIAPNTDLIAQALFSAEAWATFKDVVFPYDGRWFFH
jgi:hypothetical protein